MIDTIIFYKQDGKTNELHIEMLKSKCSWQYRSKHETDFLADYMKDGYRAKSYVFGYVPEDKVIKQIKRYHRNARITLYTDDSLAPQVARDSRVNWLPQSGWPAENIANLFKEKSFIRNR